MYICWACIRCSNGTILLKKLSFQNASSKGCNDLMDFNFFIEVACSYGKQSFYTFKLKSFQTLSRLILAATTVNCEYL